MNYWCLNPGVTFNELVNHKPVSIFLTCSHIIDAHKQLFVRVCKRSVNGTLMNFSYQNRDNSRLNLELASTIINTIVHVPAGVLVFFPSYHLMDNCIKQWKTTFFDEDQTFFEKLQTRKLICIEVKTAHTAKR